MIAIVDYGVGNLGSIYSMLKKINPNDVIIATNTDSIRKADKYILPGVGAFDTGMKLLNDSGMRGELDYQVKTNKKCILGICLGMQMLGNYSEEGKEDGLGYIDFFCKRFDFKDRLLRVPHMGWDYIEITRNSVLSKKPPSNPRFYFVHSYYAVCDAENDVLFKCDYGIDFVAGVNKENIFGVQFHPEKSHSYGLWLLKNFVEDC